MNIALRKSILFIVFISLISFSTHAKTESHSFAPFPADFMYQGKPIDPLCVEFSGDSSRFEPIDLSQCSNHPSHFVTEINPKMIAKGLFGFNYAMEEEGYTTYGASYYKILGMYKGGFILYVYYNGGGTGQFTSVQLVKREGDQLQLIEEIAGGDRCNGGIDDDIKLEKNVLILKQHITPYDLLALSKVLSKKVEAHSDLAACASCCIGNATFKYDFASRALVSVSLLKPSEEDAKIEQGNFQACLYKLLEEYQSKDELTFTPDELKVLAEKFNKNCLPIS